MVGATRTARATYDDGRLLMGWRSIMVRGSRRRPTPDWGTTARKGSLVRLRKPRATDIVAIVIIG